MVEHVTYDYTGNNIYDWIARQILRYYKKYNTNPDIIEMGEDIYILIC